MRPMHFMHWCPHPCGGPAALLIAPVEPQAATAAGAKAPQQRCQQGSSYFVQEPCPGGALPLREHLPAPSAGLARRERHLRWPGLLPWTPLSEGQRFIAKPLYSAPQGILPWTPTLLVGARRAPTRWMNTSRRPEGAYWLSTVKLPGEGSPDPSGP